MFNGRRVVWRDEHRGGLASMSLYGSVRARRDPGQAGRSTSNVSMTL